MQLLRAYAYARNWGKVRVDTDVILGKTGLELVGLYWLKGAMNLYFCGKILIPFTYNQVTSWTLALKKKKKV